MIEQDLKKIGVKANISKYNSITFFDRLSDKKFEAALSGWSAALFVDPSNIWGSPTDTNPKPFNFSSYSDPLVDALIVKGLNTSDANVERECWLEMQTLIYADQPYTFLFWRSDSFACHKRFRGIVPNILTTFHKLPSWWVPKAEHKFKF
jgi:peptide/nickel transport system substrate-binding protein